MSDFSSRFRKKQAAQTHTHTYTQISPLEDAEARVINSKPTDKDLVEVSISVVIPEFVIMATDSLHYCFLSFSPL